MAAVHVIGWNAEWDKSSPLEPMNDKQEQLALYLDDARELLEASAEKELPIVHTETRVFGTLRTIRAEHCLASTAFVKDEKIFSETLHDATCSVLRIVGKQIRDALYGSPTAIARTLWNVVRKNRLIVGIGAPDILDDGGIEFICDVYWEGDDPLETQVLAWRGE